MLRNSITFWDRLIGGLSPRTYGRNGGLLGGKIRRIVSLSVFFSSLIPNGYFSLTSTLHSSENEQMVEDIRMEFQNLTAEIFTTFKVPIPPKESWVTDLYKKLTEAVVQVTCQSQTKDWYDQCW